MRTFLAVLLVVCTFSSAMAMTSQEYQQSIDERLMPGYRPSLPPPAYATSQRLQDKPVQPVEKDSAHCSTCEGKQYLRAGNFDKAMEIFRLRAAEGDASAMNSLGVMYADGLGRPRDVNTAVEWYRKAAALGNATAALNLRMLGVSQY